MKNTSHKAIRSYLGSLRYRYLGKSHIDTLCECLALVARNEEHVRHAENWAKKVLRKWMVSSVAQWMDGILNQQMLVFVHDGQEIGMTPLMQVLIPNELKKYAVMAGSGDSQFENYFRNAFVLHDEMSGIHTDNIDDWRRLMSVGKSYKKCIKGLWHYIQVKPMAVALGTSGNISSIVRQYGSRRFCCIELEGIDWEACRQMVDIDQMWSEAFTLYELAGDSYRFSSGDYKEFEKYNGKYYTAGQKGGKG